MRWCSQVEVLSHKSLGCFMTHCGWNSTFESLCSGVPMVAFPQWTDQTTNAKLVQDVWKIGVRVNFNEDKEIVDGDEIHRCLELVMGCKEMASNAKKWMVPWVNSVFANIRNTVMVDQLNLLESSWEFFVFFIFVLKYKSNTSPY